MLINKDLRTMIANVYKLMLFVLLGFTASICRADCFDSAAQYQHVNPRILRGIAMVESHDNPHAINHNANGSIDIGLMQINSIHLAELNRFGIHRRDLMNACKNIYTAAYLLRQKMRLHGNTWIAVGSYHSETPAERDRYARLVKSEVYLNQQDFRIIRLASN
jgi:soluble lytic murein transglycosylase-like protein